MSQQHSIYTVGANDGWKMGVYLSAMFLLQAIGLNWFPGLLIGNLMMLGIAFFAYFLLRRSYVMSHGANTFSAVWLHGIIVFLCGGLLLALTVYLYARVLNPDFLAEQTRVVADAYRQLGTKQSIEMAKLFDNLISKHLLPTPIQFAFAMIWVSGFFGSMLSLILAIIIKLIPIKRIK